MDYVNFYEIGRYLVNNFVVDINIILVELLETEITTTIGN